MAGRERTLGGDFVGVIKGLGDVREIRSKGKFGNDMGKVHH